MESSSSKHSNVHNMVHNMVTIWYTIPYTDGVHNTVHRYGTHTQYGTQMVHNTVHIGKRMVYITIWYTDGVRNTVPDGVHNTVHRWNTYTIWYKNIENSWQRLTVKIIVILFLGSSTSWNKKCITTILCKIFIQPSPAHFSCIECTTVCGNMGGIPSSTKTQNGT